MAIFLGRSMRSFRESPQLKIALSLIQKVWNRRLTQCDCFGVCCILPMQKIFVNIIFFHLWQNFFAARLSETLDPAQGFSTGALGSVWGPRGDSPGALQKLCRDIAKPYWWAGGHKCWESLEGGHKPWKVANHWSSQYATHFAVGCRFR